MRQSTRIVKYVKRKNMTAVGRPRVDIDRDQLTAFMRLKPSLEDCAAFFKCHKDTITNFIEREFGLGFSAFREQNSVVTRFNMIRTAIKKAEGGDNIMLIFCLKNMCGWRDRPKDDEDEYAKMSMKDLIILAKSKLPELEAANELSNEPG